MQRIGAAQHVQGSATLGARLGKDQRAVRKIEGCEIVATRELTPAVRQCSRPAIIRWMTSQRSSSKPMATRLPTRRRLRTVRPSAQDSGGSAVRSRNALAKRTLSSGCPTIRASRALIYAEMSGNSGIEWNELASACGPVRAGNSSELRCP